MDKLNKYTNVMNDTLDDTVVVDLSVIPEGWNLDQWFNIAKTNGVMIVDSTKGGSDAINDKPETKAKIRNT